VQTQYALLRNAACEGTKAGVNVPADAMATAFARARYLSRATGGNAVWSAAYNAREAITAERTGELFHFRHRDAPAHHEVLLPEGADARLSDAAALWNAAEAAGKRKDAQVARKIVLALPADRELATADRIELARSFAEQHFVAKGLAVQLDVHAPHKERGEGEGAWAEGTGGGHTNWHAHLLITTRRIEGGQLSAKKARDLDPEVRKAGTRALVTDAEAWGETWRAHQDRYFQEHGIALRVDATAAHPGEHIGPVRMRKVDSPARGPRRGAAHGERGGSPGPGAGTGGADAQQRHVHRARPRPVLGQASRRRAGRDA